MSLIPTIKITMLEKFLITISPLGLLCFIFPELPTVQSIYTFIVLIAYATYLIISKTKLNLSKGVIVLVFLSGFLLFDGFYRQEFEYKKYKYLEIFSLLFLLQLNNWIFSKHLKFSIKIILIAIIGFHFLFVLKFLFSKYTLLYFIEYHFDNIGQYAIFIALCAIIFSFYSQTLKPKYLKIFNAIFTLLAVIAIIIIGSRTAVIIISSYYIIGLLRKYNHSKNRNTIIICCLLSLIIALTLGIKQNSSQGRFFIWKTTSEIIKDHFPTGIGYNNFPSVYPLYQASMYETGKMTKQEIHLADNTKVAFNEFLQLFTELGIAGLLLFLIIIFTYLYYAQDSRPIYISILIAMCFSYMLHSPVICYLILLILSLIQDRIKYATPRIISTSLLIFCIFIASYNLYFHLKKQECISTVRVLLKRSPDKLNGFYSTHKTFLCDNWGIINAIAEYNFRTNQTTEAISFFNQSDKLIRQNDTELLKAKNYVKGKQLKLAEKHFLLSIAICPNRFINRYELFKFYLENSKPDKALTVAKEIDNLDEKIESPHTISIKKHIREYVLKNTPKE